MLHARFIKAYGLKLGTAGTKQTWGAPCGAGREICPPDASGRRWGFDAAGFVAIFNIRNFSLLGELHYVQKGVAFKPSPARIDESGDTTFYEAAPGTRIDYLSIPVIAQARFSLGVFSPYLVIGPRLDFLVGKDSLLFLDAAQGYELKKMNFGGTIGVGVEFARAFPFALMTEVRYSPDFTKALEDRSQPGVKNRSFEILLGLRL